MGSIKYYKKIEADQLTALQTGTTGLSLVNAQRVSKIEFDLMRAAIALKNGNEQIPETTMPTNFVTFEAEEDDDESQYSRDIVAQT